MAERTPMWSLRLSRLHRTRRCAPTSPSSPAKRGTGTLRSMTVATLTLTALASPAAAFAPDMGQRIAEKFARPALADFAADAHALADSVSALCETPGADGLDAAKQAFAGAVKGWGRASVLRFGPLAAEHRFERIFFWPDPRGFILKQVQATLADKDATATDPQKLGGKSVALQGLPALEYLLYGSGSETLATGADPYRCDYAAAIAANVATVADAARAGWADGTSFTGSFTAPAADKDPYRSPEEVATEAIKALGTVLEFAVGGELTPALGEEPAKANGRRAPFWRSDLTFPLVAAQMHGARDLYLAAGFADQLSKDDAWIEESLASDVEIGEETLGAIEKPAEQAFADADDREQVATLAALLQDMHDIITQQLTAALGLSAGFNALDGD